MTARAPATASPATAPASLNAAPVADNVRIPDRLVVGMPGAFDASGNRHRWQDHQDRMGVRRRQRERQGDRPPFLRKARDLRADSVVDRQFRLANATTTVARKVTVVATSNEAPVADPGRPRDRRRRSGEFRRLEVARTGRIDPHLSVGFRGRRQGRRHRRQTRLPHRRHLSRDAESPTISARTMRRPAQPST